MARQLHQSQAITVPLYHADDPGLPGQPPDQADVMVQGVLYDLQLTHDTLSFGQCYFLLLSYQGRSVESSPSCVKVVSQANSLSKIQLYWFSAKNPRLSRFSN